MNTPKETLEAKQRLLSAGRDMQSLLENESFRYLLERIDEVITQTKQEALASKSFEALLEKRGELQGLSCLKREVDTIISRGKSAEKQLTS